MQKHTRYLHFKAVFGPWWFIVNGCWALISSADVLVAHFAPERFKDGWDAAWIAPKWGWRTWIIGMLFITVGFLFEYSYRHIKKYERDFVEERRGIESTYAITLREYSEKIAGLEQAIAEEKAKQKAPKLFLEYSGSIATQYTMTFSGLFLKNDGDRAFNVEFEPEIRSGLTLVMDNPIGSIVSGSPYAVNLQYCTIDKQGRKNPMGGVLSGRIQHLFNDLLHEGEESFTIIIKYEDFHGKKFVSKSTLTVDRWKNEISSKLA